MDNNTIAHESTNRVFTLINICIQALLVLGIYYSTLVWLIDHDWARPDFSYCYLIPFIIIYLIWQEKAQLRELPSMPSWKGIIPLGMGLLLFWPGELSGEYLTLYISLWFVVIGLIWIHMGWQKMKIIASHPTVLVSTITALLCCIRK